MIVRNHKKILNVQSRYHSIQFFRLKNLLLSYHL